MLTSKAAVRAVDGFCVIWNWSRLAVTPFSCDDGVAIGAAYLALAYFGFDEFDGIALVYHVGDVFAFVFEVVEL